MTDSVPPEFAIPAAIILTAIFIGQVIYGRRHSKSRK